MGLNEPYLGMQPSCTASLMKASRCKLIVTAIRLHRITPDDKARHDTQNLSILLPLCLNCALLNSPCAVCSTTLQSSQTPPCSKTLH